VSRPGDIPLRAAWRRRLRGWRRLAWARQWLALAAVCGIWQLWAARRGSPFLPAPAVIAVRIRQQWFSGPAGHLWLSAAATGNILPSLGRVAAGLAISVAAGVPLGLAIGRSPLVTALLAPVLSFARAVPVVTAAPVFLAIFGIGAPMEIATISFGTVWPLLLNTIAGAATIDPLHLDTARAFRLRGRDRVLRVIIPAALPQIVTGLRLSLSLALILMVYAELTGASNGIGYELAQASGSFDLTGVWAVLVLLGILGYLANAALGAAEATLPGWHHGSRRA
jgi:ABC-type nitrate/sulfonate/bicarbonate transport system permease component